MGHMEKTFVKGDKVQCISDPSKVGVVTGIGRFHGGIQYYEVFWGGPKGTSVIAGSDLRPFRSSSAPREDLRDGNLAGYREFQRLMTFHRLWREHALRNNIYAFNASRTRFYPYQFGPLIKFLDSRNQRLLIADEVGLGKTIEAGLILTELRARQNVHRVLVVCPQNLTVKWQLELKRRFGEETRRLTIRDFLEYLEEYEREPTISPINAVISFEGIRTERVLERLDALSPHFDLVIIDEAHWMRNFGANQRRAGVFLARSAGAMVLLTATPVQLGNENLFSLLNILDADDFPTGWMADTRFRENEPVIKAQICMGQIPPNSSEALSILEQVGPDAWIRRNPSYEDVLARMREAEQRKKDTQQDYRWLFEIQRGLADLNLLGHIFTRTRKREVHQHFPQRRAHAVTIELTPLEKEFYDAVTAYTKAEAAAAQGAPVILQWQINSIQRRVASSIPAMVRHFKETQELQRDLLEEDDDLSADDADTMENPMVDWQGALRRLRTIVNTWPENAVDSKYQKLADILRGMEDANGISDKVIIFAFFKQTLYYLKERLQKDGLQVELLCGDIPPEERFEIIDRFRNDKRIRILLSSRVGSEGLDFEFCTSMFNYDLPWNPMELEQRIGRIDRLGQESPVINIHNLWIRDSIEERILKRLYDRIGIFRQSIGDLEVIIGETVSELTREVLSTHLSRQEEEERTEIALRNLDRRTDDMRRLEGESARFVGTEQFFSQEVEAIHNKRRYVTGKQLRSFLSDFIRNHCPSTRIEYDDVANTGRIYPSGDIQSFIQRQGIAGDLIRFMGHAPDGMEVTFDSQIAYLKPHIEFFNVLHPLVQAIARYYRTEQDPSGSSPGHERHFASAHHVLLKTNMLPPGFYYYYVFRMDIVAARPSSSLECIILNERLQPACASDAAETIFGEMLENGQDTESGPLDLSPDEADRASDVAEGLFLDLRESLKADLEKTNDKFVEQRLASVTVLFERNIAQKRQQLDIAVFTGREDRYTRMLEGTIRRLESELAHRREELQKLRAVAVTHNDIAAGVLEIC